MKTIIVVVLAVLCVCGLSVAQVVEPVEPVKPVAEQKYDALGESVASHLWTQVVERADAMLSTHTNYIRVTSGQVAHIRLAAIQHLGTEPDIQAQWEAMYATESYSPMTRSQAALFVYWTRTGGYTNRLDATKEDVEWLYKAGTVVGVSEATRIGHLSYVAESYKDRLGLPTEAKAVATEVVEEMDTTDLSIPYGAVYTALLRSSRCGASATEIAARAAEVLTRETIKATDWDTIGEQVSGDRHPVKLLYDMVSPNTLGDDVWPVFVLKFRNRLEVTDANKAFCARVKASAELVD